MKKKDSIKFIVPSFVDLEEISSEGNESQDDEIINPWFNF